MKKTFFAAIVAVLFAVGCTNNAAKPAEGAAEQAAITSSDIAFVKSDSLLVMSDIYLTEGVALQKKLEAAQQSWAKKEQGFQYEAAQLQENFVLQNRINMLVAEAIEEINKDGKYKLILNSTALLDGAQALDITQDLLKIVNEKYAAEKAAAPKAE